MKTQTLYDLATGRLLAHVTSNSAEALAAQLQPGQALYDGVLDLKRQAIDPATGTPAEFRPADPADGSVWSEDEWRWIPLAEQNAPVLRAIEALEARQPRVLRELALGQPGAAERLQAIEDQITALRAQLKR